MTYTYRSLIRVTAMIALTTIAAMQYGPNALAQPRAGDAANDRPSQDLFSPEQPAASPNENPLSTPELPLAQPNEDLFSPVVQPRTNPDDTSQLRRNRRAASEFDRQIFRAAQEAYEQSIADFRAGKITDPEVVYRWSLRWMKAEEPLEDKAAPAAEQHLRRMMELTNFVARHPTGENSDLHKLTVKYYRAEAETLFAKAKVKPDTAPSSLHDAVIEIAEEYVKAVLQGNIEAAAKLAAPGSIAASRRLMESFKGFTSADSFTVRAIQGIGLEAGVGKQTRVSIEEAQPAESGEARAQFTISLVLRDGHWLVTNFSAHKTTPRQNNTALGIPSRPVVGRIAPPQARDGDPFGTLPDARLKETKVIVLGHAKANEIATTIANLNRASGPVDFAFAVDDRTNRLVVRGPKERIAEILVLIEQLDVPGPEQTTVQDRGGDLAPPTLLPSSNDPAR